MLLPILTFCGEKHSDPVKLAAPTLTLNSETGDAAWSAIEGATGYKYKIGDTQKVVDSSILAVRILNGESVSVMAIGDGDNDGAMIRMAGLGVAMENALDEIKKAADVITASNDADGVAIAIEKWAIK